MKLLQHGQMRLVGEVEVAWLDGDFEGLRPGLVEFPCF
jgi:hypothetical protein